jgi:hypothetical protein
MRSLEREALVRLTVSHPLALKGSLVGLLEAELASWGWEIKDGLFVASERVFLGRRAEASWMC